MTRISKKSAIAAASLAVLACVPNALRAQSKAGTAIGQFLLIEPSARITAMGNAGVAVYDGIQSIYYNPAALGPLGKYEVQFTHSVWFADIVYDYAALVVPLAGWGSVFGSVTALNSGDIDVRTVEQPLGTGERYSVSDVALALAYGRELTQRFGAGVQVNYLDETIWHSSLRTVTFNVGTAYRLTDNGMILGASLSNFGTNARFEGRDLAIQYDNDPSRNGDNSALPGDRVTDEFPVPMLFRVGVTVPRRFGNDNRVLFALDAFHPADNTESVSAGAEWTWKNALALRAGWQNLYMEDADLGLTLGVGVRGALGKERAFRFDYAWADHARLEETHRLTLALVF
jgi:long-subunit fatty acid transport protein